MSTLLASGSVTTRLSFMMGFVFVFLILVFFLRNWGPVSCFVVAGLKCFQLALSCRHILACLLTLLPDLLGLCFALVEGILTGLVFFLQANESREESREESGAGASPGLNHLEQRAEEAHAGAG